MKFDEYSLKARIIPTLFSIVPPIIVFNHFYINEEFSKFVGDILVAKIFSDISISVICLYFLSETGYLFQKIYSNAFILRTSYICQQPII